MEPEPEDRRGTAANDLRFVYDGWNLLPTLTSDLGLLTSFTWGLDLSGSLQGAGGVGGLLAVIYFGAQTTNAFPAFDGNGNVMALVNAADGKIVANYDYGPFGEVLRATGPMAKPNAFDFSTKYRDDETDLLYYGYRYYDPSTGSWKSRDRKQERGGYNLYGQSKNTPVNRFDPVGLASLAAHGAGQGQGDYVDDCGGFDGWKIRWELESPSGGSGGFIVQEVRVSFEITTCEGYSIEPEFGKHYPLWEAWKVAADDTLTVYARNPKPNQPFYDDKFALPRLDNTVGKMTITATADYYDGLTSPSSWTISPPEEKHPAGGLPHTPDDPHLSGGRGPLTRTLTAQWDCCCSIDRKTQVTKSTQ